MLKNNSLNSNLILVTMSSRSRCLVFQMMCKDEDEAECFWSDIVGEYSNDDWTWLYNPLNELSNIPVYNSVDNRRNIKNLA